MLPHITPPASALPSALPPALTMSDLRIGVDGYNLALKHGTGVTTYAWNLIQCLKNMKAHIDILYGLPIEPIEDSRLQEVMFFECLGADHKPPFPRFPSLPWWRKNVQHLRGHTATIIPLTGRAGPIDQQARLPPHDRILNVNSLYRAASGFFRTTGRFLDIRIPDPPDVMHWTYPVPVRLANSRNVYTLHDIVPLQLPFSTLDNKPFYFRLLQKVIEEADALCTVSETSRKAIVSLFPESQNKLYNTYQTSLSCQNIQNAQNTGPSSSGQTTEQTTQTTRTLEALFDLKPEKYFLFFGQFEPKKNIGRLIRAFLEARTLHPLVLVGSTAWKEEDELRFLQRGIDTGRIIHLPYLPTDTLHILISHARALLFPSIAEGFGLPVLEAYNLGTAVLTSREGALAEVAGDAALLVDPYDMASIQEGIERLDRDDALRKSLAKAGLRQKELFSPAAYQERLKDFYHRIL